MPFEWRRVKGHIRSQITGLSVLLLLVLFQAVLIALQPWPAKLIIDNVLGEQPFPVQIQNLLPTIETDKPNALLLLASALLCLFLLQRTVLLIQAWLNSTIGNRLTYSVGAELYDHLQNQSQYFHTKERSGDLIRKITQDSRYVRQLVLDVLLPTMTALSSLAFLVSIMLSMNVFMTLIALVSSLPIPLIIKYLAEKLTTSTYNYQAAESSLTTHVEQSLTNLPVIQAFNQTIESTRRFSLLCNSALRRYLETTCTQLKFQTCVDSSLAAGTATMLVVGGHAVINGVLTVGELTVFVAYLAALYQPMQSLAYMASGVADAKARAIRVNELMNRDERVQVKDAALNLSTHDNLKALPVTFENVQFAYDAETTVIDHVSLKINAGETLALVGATGSGKSTLASLLLRFYDPQSGRVLVGGHDVRDLTLSSLRKSIAVVLQEPFLFPVSVADNIAYGSTGASRMQIMEAAKLANAEEFINQLPDGFDTVLNERGTGLSGGQCQRISIARALLKNAPVLILDEPTSALDIKTEGAVLMALKRLRKDRTTLVIAHRMSTIRDADRIAVLDNGRVVESGSHNELLELKGIYSKLNTNVEHHN